MEKLRGLQPEKVFEYFELLSSVPHGSGNTDAISSLCVEFAKEHGFRYVRDELNNVIIYAPASKGCENADTVILQGHMDMVCAKAAGYDIDMLKEAIDVYYEGDFVKARNTSLGGDDGIAVAMIMAVLDSDEIRHPAIEAVFTVDEEIGLLGAEGLDGNLLSGKNLINIDSEEEGVFTCGCAGGVRVEGVIPVSCGITEEDCELYFMEIGGLKGGHSGCDIEKGRANSNHLAGRMLNAISKKAAIRLISFEGGHFDNVIAASTKLTVAVKSEDTAIFKSLADEYDKTFKQEYASTDGGVYVDVKRVSPDAVKNGDSDCFEKVSCDGIIKDSPTDNNQNKDETYLESVCGISTEDSRTIFSLLSVLPQGVIEMSSDIKGLVQTSLNLGITRLEKECFRFSFCVRSSVASQKKALVEVVTELTERYGGTVSLQGDYPGWTFNRNSKLREICRKSFVELFGKEPVITATHGGLECGLFTEKVKDIDCISIGPDLYEIHSERERLSISSTERLWRLLVKVLENLCEN